MPYITIQPRLYVKCRAGGSKQFVYRYCQHGLQVEKSLGSATGVGKARMTASIAKRLADKYDGQLAQGLDPFAQETTSSQTFGSLFLQTLEVSAQKNHWNDRSRNSTGSRYKWMRTYGELGAIAGMTLKHPRLFAEIVKLLREDPLTSRQAERRGHLDLTFRAAVAMGLWKNPINPADKDHFELVIGGLRNTRSIHEGGQTNHRNSLPAEEVAGFLGTIAARKDGQSDVVKALTLLTHTAARSFTVVFAMKSEFDLGAGTWTVPASKMKKGRRHTYYLSRQALAIVSQMWDRHEGDRLFDIAQESISEFIRLKLKMNDRVMAHGMRASFKGFAKKLGKSDLASEMLAHQVESRTGRSYAGDIEPGELMRALAQLWADTIAPSPEAPALKLVG